MLKSGEQAMLAHKGCLGNFGAVGIIGGIVERKVSLNSFAML